VGVFAIAAGAALLAWRGTPNASIGALAVIGASVPHWHRLTHAAVRHAHAHARDPYHRAHDARAS